VRRFTLYILLFIILCSCCLPAGAILPTYTYRGSVIASQPGTGNVSILATHKWGCSTDDGNLTCGWIGISPLLLTGKVPADEAFSVLKTGTTIEATSIGTAGGTWIGLGLLIPDYQAGGWYARDLFGDLTSLPAPLTGSYSVTAVTTPDCGNCSGSRCTAASSAVAILRNGGIKVNGTLLPGQVLTYDDCTDRSGIAVTFIRGEAGAQLCPNSSGGGFGVQPVSVYIVRIEPSRIGPIPTPQTTTGTLAVASVPSGAAVILDGKELGLTPFSRSGLVPGSYSLRVEKEGYAPWDKVVTVFPGRYSTWTASLTPLNGFLSVRSSPSHAMVILDGEERGFTPLTLSGIPAGPHQVTVSKEGYRTEDRPAQVAGGDITLLLVNLAPLGAGADQAAGA
jgi:hypothetical protein